MNAKNSMAIMLMGVGVIAIYLGASGHLQSFWTGLTGGYDGSGSPPIEDASDGGSRGGGAVKNMGNELGNISHAAAGEAVGRSRATRGTFYTVPTGTMYVSDAGSY